MMTASEAPRPELTIGLLWHSPNSGNLGVGALTLGNIALARKAAEEGGTEPGPVFHKRCCGCERRRLDGRQEGGIRERRRLDGV